MEIVPEVERKIWERVRYYTQHLWDLCSCEEGSLVPCGTCRTLFQEFANWYGKGRRGTP